MTQIVQRFARTHEQITWPHLNVTSSTGSRCSILHESNRLIHSAITSAKSRFAYRFLTRRRSSSFSAGSSASRARIRCASNACNTSSASAGNGGNDEKLTSIAIDDGCPTRAKRGSQKFAHESVNIMN